jgi:hypothetical protein
VYFGSRLCYLEGAWIASALWDTLVSLAGPDVDLEVGKMLIDLGSVERVDLLNPKLPVPILSDVDIVAWRRDKYRGSFNDYRITKSLISFYYKPSLDSKHKDFLRDFENFQPDELYYSAVDFINPRTDLLFGLVGDSVTLQLASP